MTNSSNEEASVAALGPKQLISAVIYMAMSISLSFVARHILHERSPPMVYTALLVGFQAVIYGLITLVGLATCWRAQAEASVYWPKSLNATRVGIICVVGCLLAADILLTLTALSVASVALVEIVKCLTPVIVLVQLSLIYCTLPAFGKSFFVLVICLGVVLASAHGGFSFSDGPGGVAYSITAAFVAGARLVSMQLLLHNREPCPVPLLVGYVSIAQSIAGFAVFLLYELPHENGNLVAFNGEHFGGTIAWMTLSAVLAFGLNLSEVWVIDVTDALVMTLTGAVKTILVVMLTAIFVGRLPSLKAAIGSILAIGGVVGLKPWIAAVRVSQFETSFIAAVDLHANGATYGTFNSHK